MTMWFIPDFVEECLPKKKHTLSVAPKKKGTHKANDMFIVQEVKAESF